MKKKKKYCAQRHLNGREVGKQLLHVIYHFRDKILISSAHISSMNLQPRLCRISITPDAKGYFPHKGWAAIKNSCFQGKFIAWIAEFSFTSFGDKEDMLAVYKIKNGEKILVKKDNIKIEYLWSPFVIGANRFSIKRGRHNLMQYTVQRVH